MRSLETLLPRGIERPPLSFLVREFVLFAFGCAIPLMAMPAEAAPTNGVLRVAARECRTAHDTPVYGLSDYGWRVFDRIANALGYRAELQPCARSHDIPELVKRGVDVIPAVFWTSTITNDYAPIEQPLASVAIELSVPADRVLPFDVTLPSSWPRIRVARVMGPLDTLPDFREWADRNVVNAVVIDYESVQSAIEAVRTGECDLLLLAACALPPGFSQIVEICHHQVFLAVRKELKDLHAAVTKEMESVKLNDQPWLDEVYAKSFGIAPGTNLIRLAVHFEPGLFERGAYGRIRGQAVEYARRIASLNDWLLDPVFCSYGDALKALGEGKLDLVGGVTITDDRLRKLEFARFPTGIYQNFLYSKKLESIESANLSNGLGLHIVMGPGDEARERLEDYLAGRRIRARITELPTATAAVSAYQEGRADALFSGASPLLSEKEVVITFPSEPWFFCVPRGRSDLREAVESAIAHIQASAPNLPERVQYGHYPAGSGSPLGLTRKERQWLAERVSSGRRVRVEVFPPLTLWKEWDSERQQIRGRLKVYLEAIAARTGLRFEFLPPVSLTTARERYVRGEVDIWASYPADLSCLPSGGETQVILNHPVICAINRYAPDPKPGVTRFAVMDCDRSRRDLLTRHGYGDRLVLCPTAEACFRKVVDGEADATLTTSGTALVMMRRLKTNNALEVRALPEFSRVDEMAFHPSPKADPMLVAILEKTMKSLSTLDSEQMLHTVMFGGMNRPLFTPIQFALLISCLVIVVLLVTGIFIVLFAIRAKRSSIAAEEAGRMKTQFLATMSHEIRTPLNVLVGFAEFLGRSGLTGKQIQEYTKGIGLASKALLSLVNDILDLAKLDSGRMMDISGVCSLPELFSELKMLFSGMARAKGLSFVMSLHPGIPSVGISSQRVRQILFNLIGNAIKFTERGEVSVEAFAEPASCEGFLNLTFRVKDSGIGVSQEKIESIFNPFEQDILTRSGKVFKGTGLGLAIVKRLVEAVGGSVTVDSRPGRGALFVVRMPNLRIISAEDAEKQNLPPENPIKIQPRDVADLKVLVVDDVALNLRIFTLHLVQLGVKAGNIATVPDGIQAMSFFEREKPDVVFTDMWMPAMNGAELLSAIRKTPWGARMPVIAVTADADPVATFDLSQFDGILMKPVTSEKMMAVLSDVLKKTKEGGTK